MTTELKATLKKLHAKRPHDRITSNELTNYLNVIHSRLSNAELFLSHLKNKQTPCKRLRHTLASMINDCMQILLAIQEEVDRVDS